ncbi:GntR family transcriptional regulator [Pseudonocardia xishanensis]|uniref:GntR family transcriptional regulator n=1 Tax=Pseudonocardia xishanensis TaxID=630995 RepID=UPI0031E9B322
MTFAGGGEDEKDEGLAQYAYRTLRQLVRSGRFQPDVLVSEQKLTEEIGVGRTPVREAVSRLAHEGLLDRLPKRGVRIRTLDIDEIRDLYDLREWMEVLCARRAVANFTEADVGRVREELARASESVEAGCSWLDYRDCDRRFHHALWVASRNQRAIDLLLSLHDAAILDPSFQKGPDMPQQGRTSIQEHKAILDAIEARDVEAAEAATIAHARSYRTALADRLFGPKHWTGDHG